MGKTRDAPEGRWAEARAPALSVLQVGFQLFRAIWTDAVGEADAGVTGNVGFQAVPVVLIVANSLAVAADGQQAVELVHFQESVFQSVKKLFRVNSVGYAKGYLPNIDWFRQEIVRAGFNTHQPFLSFGQRGHHQNLDWSGLQIPF